MILATTAVISLCIYFAVWRYIEHQRFIKTLKDLSDSHNALMMKRK